MTDAHPGAVPVTKEVKAAADSLRASLPGAADARTLVIAGSGLGGFVNAVEPLGTVSYADIPGVGASTVAGHSGQLLYGHVGPSHAPALVMAGRRHLYEGLSPAAATLLPQILFAAWPSLKNVIISNAAGGLNPAFSVGDLMLIADHINFTFSGPLLPPAFAGRRCDPRHAPVYDPALRALAEEAALDAGVPLRRGTYLSVMGPSYETRAEIAMMRHLFGADAVGMSTVPEATLAAALGRRVLGISFISNMLVEPAPLTHAEVVENAVLVEQKFAALVVALLEKIHQS